MCTIFFFNTDVFLLASNVPLLMLFIYICPFSLHNKHVCYWSIMFYKNLFRFATKYLFFQNKINVENSLCALLKLVYTCRLELFLRRAIYGPLTTKSMLNPVGKRQWTEHFIGSKKHSPIWAYCFKSKKKKKGGGGGGLKKKLNFFLFKINNKNLFWKNSKKCVKINRGFWTGRSPPPPPPLPIVIFLCSNGQQNINSRFYNYFNWQTNPGK